jgi:glycosyltransferase involved in cell wall biosynthesis
VQKTAMPEPLHPTRTSTAAPVASVIVPCRNESGTIGLLLDSLAGQTIDATRLEVIVADGRSDDGTRETIARWRSAHPELDVHVVDNPRLTIPSGLNLALERAAGEVVLRVDAHARPHPDFVERSLDALDASGADCVGGRIEVVGDGSPTGDAIAFAVSHPFGVGDAKHRVSGRPGPVDTVPFVCFRRELIDRIGKFDEGLLANQDYEFNFRVRHRGGRVWFDPAIRAEYFSRGTLRGLARQYARYGSWKVRMLRRSRSNRRSLRPRQLAAPGLVLSVASLAVASGRSRVARRLLGAELVAYGAVLGIAAADALRATRRPAVAARVPAAIAVMHLAWGAGFLAVLVRGRSADAPVPPSPSETTVPPEPVSHGA